VTHREVASLVRRKFAIEGGSARYKAAGITNVAHIPRVFADERKRDELRAQWDQAVTNDLLLVSDDELREVAFVERTVDEFWVHTMDLLAPDPRLQPR